MELLAVLDTFGVSSAASPVLGQLSSLVGQDHPLQDLSMLPPWLLLLLHLRLPVDKTVRVSNGIKYEADRQIRVLCPPEGKRPKHLIITRFLEFLFVYDKTLYQLCKYSNSLEGADPIVDKTRQCSIFLQKETILYQTMQYVSLEGNDPILDMYVTIKLCFSLKQEDINERKSRNALKQSQICTQFMVDII